MRWDLRAGHIVLFQIPGNKQHSGIELGLVISVWQGIKAPKLTEKPVHVNSCMAFRAIGLDMVDQEKHNPHSLKMSWSLVYVSISGLYASLTCFIQVFNKPNADAAPMLLQEDASQWFCEATSSAWVVRLESLVTILDCTECNLEADFRLLTCLALK